MQKQRNPRRGLQRLSCSSCGAGVYATWHAVESRPLPVCGGCGDRFLPDCLELLALVLSPAELERTDVGAEYGREVARIVHGQAGPARSSRRTDGGQGFTDPTLLAAERVERARRDSAHRRQLDALRPAAEPMAF